MLRVVQIKMDIEEDIALLEQKIREKLKLNKRIQFTYKIHRRNIDARDKDHLYFVYSVDVKCDEEEKILRKHLKDVSKAPYISNKPLSKGVRYLQNPPIVVGFGPAGMFASLLLAQYGYCPIVLERGDAVDKRTKKVEAFFNDAILDEESNIQYGEGGAGTFSDGKLTARSKDVRVQKVYDTFVSFGAPKEIAYESFPHVGSDKLKTIVKNIREEVIALGGKVHFNTKVESLIIEDGKVKGVKTNKGNFYSTQIILAIGNSARDTVYALYEQGVCMEAKPLAIGFRIEHKQKDIDEALYHQYANHPSLSAASYRLSNTAQNGRGVYTFCMCPGGSVVAATSLKEHVVVNGMSNYARDLENANSAVLVQVNEEDYGNGIFDGMHYLDNLEKQAFVMGGKNYKAPCQKVVDYLNNVESTSLGNIKPSYPIGVKLANLNTLFSDSMNEALKEGLLNFDKKLKGFASEDAIITGIETRSSAPIRIVRDKDTLISLCVDGLYPCGEGAGYAGGIVSSAIDGLKCAEKIITEFNYEKESD